MKRNGLIIGLATLMLLTSCGGTRYTKTSDATELFGIRTEASEVLTMYEDTFRLEIINTTTYSEDAASKIEVNGKVKEENIKVYTGDFTKDSGLLSGSTVYVLKAKELKYTIKLSEKGKDEYKSKVIDREKNSYTEEEAKKLADGWAVTSESDATFKVTLDSENESFSYSLGI